MRRLLALAALAAAGCGGGVTPPDTRDVFEKRKDAQAEMVGRLKLDPQPVIDFAEAHVKKILPEQWGDEVAKGATVKADPGSLRTFGGARWKLKGTARAKRDGKDWSDTPWVSEVELRDGELRNSVTVVGAKD